MILNNDAFYLKSVNIALNKQLSINVVCFEFTSQLLCLLQNKSLTAEKNLLCDVNNPSSMYHLPKNLLHEALNGSVYKVIYNREHSNHTGNSPLLLIPTYLLGDATDIDTAGRFKLVFYSLNSQKEVRCNKIFWGILR